MFLEVFRIAPAIRGILSVPYKFLRRGEQGTRFMELLGKSLEELQELCVAMGEPRFRAAQIYGALYAERKLTLDEMTTLPKALRERLVAETRITLPQVKQRFVSSDGAIRYLMHLPQSEEKATARPASVEAVFMPSEGRQTICISTQAVFAGGRQILLAARVGPVLHMH